MDYSKEFNEHYKTRKQTGRGIIHYNNPHKLLQKQELLDGSLIAGNNGALPEYTQIAHHLSDIGTISNKQLNALLRKYIDI